MPADARALLRTLATLDHRAAVYAACQVARTVLHLVPEGEQKKARKAIKLAQGWVRGEVGMGKIYFTKLDYRPNESMALLAALLAFEAARQAAVWTNPGDQVFRLAPRCAHAAALAAMKASTEQERDGRLARLRGFILVLRWPLTRPTAAQVQAAPPGAQVAWDAVAGVEGDDLSIAALVEAHERSVRFGVSWADPVVRAVAERAADREIEVGELINSAGRAA